jgi:hypothetical protein
MATPQMALNECDIPLHAVINVNADGTIAGRSHRFIFDQGTVQFVSACPTALVATFSPVGVFGDPVTGEVEIPGNGSTAQLTPSQINACVNYQISGDSIATTPNQSISVGCAPLAIVVDADGSLSIEDSCIPNGGAITFVGASDIPHPGGVTLTFTTNDPGKGSPLGQPITVRAGKSHSLHAISTDVTVTVSTDASPDGTGGTVKIGSGGTGPVK